MSLLNPRACICLYGILTSIRWSFSNNMTPSILLVPSNTLVSLLNPRAYMSLWHTNTSLTPLSSGLVELSFCYRVSTQGSLPKGLPKGSPRAAVCSCFNTRLTTNCRGLHSHVNGDPKGPSLMTKQQLLPDVDNQ